MRYKFLLFFILLPLVVFGECNIAGCCIGNRRWCSKYRPCCCETSLKCTRLSLPGWWLDAEYLLLWRKSRFYPPLVTTNTLGNAPALGVAGTEVLFGDESLRKSPKSGMRGDAGFWITPCLGVGGGGWGVKDEKIHFFASGDIGNPILGRPFFNVITAAEDAVLISSPFPIFNSGSITISAENSLCGGDAYARYRLLATKILKFDLLGGYTMSRISDSLDIDSFATNEILIRTQLHDHFDAENTFYAGLVGLLAEFRSKNWSLFFTGKLGIGNMVRSVEIDGSTTLTSPLGTIGTFNGGLLAQTTNIGQHGENAFALGSQISAQLQLRIWEHFWFTVGYTHFFWQHIALAGNQIDLNVNPTQELGGVLIGSPAPLFEMHDTNFYMHGLSAGLYILY